MRVGLTKWYHHSGCDVGLLIFFTKLVADCASIRDQYSQSAYRYGAYVAKLGVFPIGEEQLKLKSCK